MDIASPPIWAALPFLVLLAAIAIGPLVNNRWWERFYPAVSIGLALVTTGYYLFFLHALAPLLDSGHDYISFIALIGSLYIIAGGIHIRLRGESRPIANVVFLAIGAVLANLLGTTGASMILIRPYVRVNRYRIKPFHIIFFIFIVSNVGGALTPIGDPPLFLGFLKGIPFFWPVENLWHIWFLAVTIILVVFYFIDRRDFLRLSRTERQLAEELSESGEVTGLHNIIFLAVVIGAIFITHPLFLRELLMVLAAAASYIMTKSETHKKNDFDFLPIKEVSILFIGIFITMVPALEWIRQNAAHFGLQGPGDFYWSSGALSSVLDNTPTYINFLSAALGRFVDYGTVQHIHHLIQTHAISFPFVAGKYPSDIRSTLAVLIGNHSAEILSGRVTTGQIATAYLLAHNGIIVQAISIGAVFFGAMTYIGNGPNFMVKSIAEQSGVRCPSFVSYMFRYALPVLLPTLILIWLLFFR
ncbi:MAG: sodium:proton antiporter [Bacteroidetes bacterium]|nr:sodium:proton antiporter [Bacteroidota bacterium]